MNRESRQPHDADETVVKWVRDFLDGQSQRLETKSLVHRILQTAGEDEGAQLAVARSSPTGGARGTRQWSLAWTALVLCVGVAAFLGGRRIGPGAANASLILHDVRDMHLREVDRSYLVQYAPDPGAWDKSNVLEGPSETILWTRGDRFWADCAIAGQQLKFGCEQDGTLWFCNSRKKGIRFPTIAACPENISMLCAVNSMTVPALVRDVLTGFDLQTIEPVRAEGARLISARLRSDHEHPLLSAALLEIDVRTGVLSRLVLWIVRDGQPRGTATFTLIDRAQGDDRQYQLESHLDDDAVIQLQSWK